MAIQLQLVNTSSPPVWFPGGNVTGTVQFRADKQIDVDRVMLHFEGRVKSRVTIRSGQKTTVYRTYTTLFSQSVVLFKGPYTLAKSQDWPFEVQIPWDCRGAKYPQLQPEPHLQARFNKNPAQPLPPSMEARDDGFLTTRKQCEVRYRLNAVLERSAALKFNLEASQDLKFLPYRDEQYRNLVPRFDAYPRRIMITSLHLDPDVGDRELKFKEKFKSAMGSSSIPSVSFDVVVEVPDACIISEKFPVFLSIKHPSGTEKGTPPVALKMFRLTLLTHTAQCTQRG